MKIQPIFGEEQEQELRQLRIKFGTQQFNKSRVPSQKDQNKIISQCNTNNNSPVTLKNNQNKFSLSLSNLQFSKSQALSSARKSANENTSVIRKISNTSNTNQVYNFSIPNWITERNDFQQWKQQTDFDINLKIVSICKLESFKRDQSQKTFVALYLQKLSLFKLMPFQLLLELASRINYKEIKTINDQTLCKQGDNGNCMFIIFKGVVKVIIDGICKKEFREGEHLGRNALENDTPRNATLICSQDSHILILLRWDYQQCLNNLFKQERSKWIGFINSIHFFKNFQTEKIKRLCEELKGRFLSTKDCLYKVGDPIDNFYIVKNGTLVKKVVVNIEKSNRWPTATRKWIQNTYATRQEIAIKFEPKSLLGYYEIVTQESLGLKTRTEEIDAQDDCFLLYIPKTKFSDIFDSEDQKIFKELFLKLHPTSFDQLIERVKAADEQKYQEYRTIKEALQEGLQYTSQQQLEKKSKKFFNVIKTAQTRLHQYQATKGIISTEIRQKEMRSIYE